MGQLPKHTHPDLIVGFETSDDAGVFRLRDDLALVQTVDFLTPMVDDPFMFGAISAANALSDVYAMGGKPVTAMNIVSFPVRKVPLEILERILAGGFEKVHEAGAILVGGHTVDDPEPKFGMSVTGVVHPERVIANRGAKPGDRLVLTKPIGVGILTTALKEGLLQPPAIEEVSRVMATLNRAASEAMVEVGVHAATDVTGFGLLGHLHEMLAASEVSSILSMERIPRFEGVFDWIRQDVVPGGTRRNLRTLEEFLRGESSPEERLLLADAQTSGGLLMAVPPDHLDRLFEAFRARGVRGWEIGEISENPATAIEITR